MSDLLTKAKALSALEAGVIPRTTHGYAYHAVRFVLHGGRELLTEVPFDGEHDTPIDALAAAADALDLTPDSSILSGGVTLSEEEKERTVPVLRDVFNMLHSDGVQKVIRYAADHAEHLGLTTAELEDVLVACVGWSGQARKVDALLTRLTEGGE